VYWCCCVRKERGEQEALFSVWEYKSLLETPTAQLFSISNMDKTLRELVTHFLNWLDQHWKYPSTKEEYENYLKQKYPHRFQRVEKKTKKQEEVSEEKEHEILVRTLQSSEIGEFTCFLCNFSSSKISEKKQNQIIR
jgi:hypothetical protein